MKSKLPFATFGFVDAYLFFSTQIQNIENRGDFVRRNELLWLCYVVILSNMPVDAVVKVWQNMESADSSSVPIARRFVQMTNPGSVPN